MAKTIKFNLIIDGKPARTLEDLRAAFNVDDMLFAYKNEHLLMRWLDVRGYSTELEKVKSISSTNNYDICSSLIEIFKIEADEYEVNVALSHLKTYDEKEVRLNTHKNTKKMEQETITNYHTEYEVIKRKIEDNFQNYSLIRAQIAHIESDFMKLFALDRWDFIDHFNAKAPLAVFNALGNTTMRNVILADPAIERAILKILSSSERESIFKRMEKKENEYLKEVIKCHENNTKGGWQPVVPEGKKYMILRQGSSCHVRSADQTDESVNIKSDNHKILPILNGLEYSSMGNGNFSLFYMEV